MLFRDITLLDENLKVKEHQYVGIEKGKIDYIGDQKPEKDYGDVYEGKDRLLMSAFYNAHAHTPMVLMRGYGENLVLSDWLHRLIFPFEAKLKKNDVYYGMLLGIAEMVRFGVISTTDMYMQGEMMIKAAIESGVKGNYGFGLTCFDDKDLKDIPAYHETKSLFETYHLAEDERIKIDVSIHGEYTSTPKVVKAFADYAKKIQGRVNLHLSETSEEHEACKKRHGKTPAKYFYDLGVFDQPATAAHCVYLEEEDFALLSEKGVTVASCPVSNLKLASGVANIKKMYEEGIAVAIGTDSVASNNSINFIEEMKFFALLQKGIYKDPTLITPDQTIYAATLAGAKAQGRMDAGRIKIGNRADLIVVDLSAPHMQPVHHLKNNLIYSASGSDVLMTMCDGKIVYKEGEFPTIDVERAIYETNQSKNQILQQLI